MERITNMLFLRFRVSREYFDLNKCRSMESFKKVLFLVAAFLPSLLYGIESQYIINQLEARYAGDRILVQYVSNYNLYSVIKWVKINGKEYHLYGICDGRGNEIFAPKYGGLSTPEFGYCIFSEHRNGYKGYVKIDEGRSDQSESFNLYGIIDDQGRMVVPCIYSKLSIIPGTPYAIVEKGGVYYWDDDYNDHAKKYGKYGIINYVSNKEIVKCQYDFIDHKFDKVEEYTYCPTDKRIIEEKIQGIRIRFNSGGKRKGVYGELVGGKWGFLDLYGKEIIPVQYETATNFKDGYSQVYKDGQTSLIGIDGLPYGLSAKSKSKVDVDIPVTNKQNENTFAFIIANENYNTLKGADFSINDGKTFFEYCKKTLGIPVKNIKYYEDASFGNMQSAIKRMRDIADAYDGDANVILYFSGLGATDTKDGESYLLPSDVSVENLKVTGLGILQLREILCQMNVLNALVIIDAPFSNTDKFGRNLRASRGISIKPKSLTPAEKITFLISSEDGQKTYSSKEYSHGLFTYALLEKIKSTKGNCSYQELYEYIKSSVKKESLKLFNDIQSPVIITLNQKDLKINKLW